MANNKTATVLLLCLFANVVLTLAYILLAIPAVPLFDRVTLYFFEADSSSTAWMYLFCILYVTPFTVVASLVAYVGRKKLRALEAMAAMDDPPSANKED